MHLGRARILCRVRPNLDDTRIVLDAMKADSLMAQTADDRITAARRIRTANRLATTTAVRMIRAYRRQRLMTRAEIASICTVTGEHPGGDRIADFDFEATLETLRDIKERQA